MANIIAHSDNCVCDVCTMPQLNSKLAYMDDNLCSALSIRKDLAGNWYVTYIDNSDNTTEETTIHHWNHAVYIKGTWGW